MALFEQGELKIHYEERGEGFPVLALAPGGLRSTIGHWDNAPWNVVDQLAEGFRVIALDQRNAGGSWAPVSASDGWHTYTEDHLALLDHLGIERFAAIGMCIGGAFICSLLEKAPERVAAAVALQPIGLSDNRHTFYELFDSWAADIRDDHPEATDADWAVLREHLYGGDHTLWSVPDSALSSFATPLLVALGNDVYHPQNASRTLAERAPNATLIERWKDGESIPVAQKAVWDFLVSAR